MGSIATKVAPVANFALGLKPTKVVMDAVLKVDKHRTFPQYASKTFESWYKKNVKAFQDSFKHHVSFFHGCYVNYNYPQLGKDLISVMNALGYGVHMLENEKCCGTALISNRMPRGLYPHKTHPTTLPLPNNGISYPAACSPQHRQHRHLHFREIP